MGTLVYSDDPDENATEFKKQNQSSEKEIQFFF